MESAVVGGALLGKTGCEGCDTGARFGSVGGHGGARGEDGAGDVRAGDCWIGGDGEAVVALVIVDWVECDRFYSDDKFGGTGVRGWAVGDFGDGAFGCEDSGKVLVCGRGRRGDVGLGLVDGGRHDGFGLVVGGIQNSEVRETSINETEV